MLYRWRLSALHHRPTLVAIRPNPHCTELPSPRNSVTPLPGSSLCVARVVPFRTLMCISPPPSSLPPSSSSSPSPAFTLSTFPMSPFEIFKPGVVIVYERKVKLLYDEL
ncbi:hypothetical protein AHAS_Ahas11G0151900 [Arachis hypogaea]